MDRDGALFERTESALRAAGCVAADLEAEELIAFAHGDKAVVADLVAQRSTGVPFAWLVGSVEFCGVRVGVAPGVYPPRWQSEPLAERAGALLADDGVAIDLGTGSGALAMVLHDRHPLARVLGTEVDPTAAACARHNGIEVAFGPLFSAVPAALMGSVDLIVGVLPYVPTDEMHLLPRDVIEFEPRTALDGGERGLEIVRTAITESARWLRAGGHLLLEVGGDQVDLVSPALESAGFTAVSVIYDADGDPRAVEAVAILRHLSL